MRSLLVPLVRRDRLELGIVAVHAWGVIAIVRDPEIAQSASVSLSVSFVLVVRYQVFETEIGIVVLL